MKAPSAPQRLPAYAWAAVAAAAVAAVGTLAAPEPAPVPIASGSAKRLALLVACSGAAIPEGSVCVPLPPLVTAGPAPLRGAGEGIPRRPDRPAAFEVYRFPFGAGGKPHRVGLVETDRNAVPGAARAGDFALVLWDAPDAKVELVRLAGQEGDADVVWVGDLRGTTVVTRHVVREARGPQSVLLFVGNLSKALVAAGDAVADGEPLGKPGVVGGAGVVILEARKVREASPLERSLPHATADELVAASQAIPVDPRNILALRGPP